jgi:LPS-assembly lipoprotein
MSLFSRRSILILLALSGCGFTPALGTGGAATGLIGRVRAEDPTDAPGFDLVRRLEERLGPPSVAEYDLTYRITTGSEGVAITADGAITRYNLTGAVEWALVRRADGLRMASGTEASFTAYSATGSTVAGLAAQEDATRRLMVILADQIVARLMVAALPA